MSQSKNDVKILGSSNERWTFTYQIEKIDDVKNNSSKKYMQRMIFIYKKIWRELWIYSIGFDYTNLVEDISLI